MPSLVILANVVIFIYWQVMTSTERTHVSIWPTSRGGVPAVSQAHRAAAVLTAPCPRRAMQAADARPKGAKLAPAPALLDSLRCTCYGSVHGCGRAGGGGPGRGGPRVSELFLATPFKDSLTSLLSFERGSAPEMACRREVGRTLKLCLCCSQYGDICKRARHL